MNKNNKLYSTVAEAAEMMAVSRAYVRELLNRGKVDKSIKIKGMDNRYTVSIRIFRCRKI
ncbi:MAG: hypothetical protein E7213_09425 [Clostridium sp.]|nr:hypothetical protein [Clostridium sp.]